MVFGCFAPWYAGRLPAPFIGSATLSPLIPATDTANQQLLVVVEPVTARAVTDQQLPAARTPTLS
jgi:hypothetical protein